MIELAYGFSEVPVWVSQRVPGDGGFGACYSIGVVIGSELVAGIVYHNWDPQAGVIELSAAATDSRWLSGPTIRAMFEYPFDQVGCQTVFLRVLEDNKRMCRIAERFGFDKHRIPRLGGRDKAMMIYTLTSEQWSASRFNRSNADGQAVRTEAA